MDILRYIDKIRTLYASGQTTEHSFRPALAELFGDIDTGLSVINEPKHLTDVGAPDFVFNRGEVAIGWCEAKDIDKDIRNFSPNEYSKEQKSRYIKGLPNLIYTNGLDFEFIRDGDAVDFVSIAKLKPDFSALPENFATLETRLHDFAAITPLSVTSSKRLAQIMAGKAAIIKDIMGRALVVDMQAHALGVAPTDLVGQYKAFQANLIHDITVADFADIYAETIAYGLFAARLHDNTPGTFSRPEALELLPKSNPFLRELFIYIAGPTLDQRLRRVIDQLCDVFRATNMPKVLANFGKFTGRADPFLHFYETFLAEYNPSKRRARGVWYTPEPVVNFIVRAVDEVLKSEFELVDGLADTSRITIDWDTGQNNPKTGKPATFRKEVHRVQILDPATGTGTFLAEVVKLVAGRIGAHAPGQWSNYVEHDLIPRLNGFELLMASYAMCHMKLDMVLTELGYHPSANPPRLGVYLTNSLEEGERVEQTLFGLSRAIANEAKAASDIKRQTPIMCVIGNPPYSVSNINKSKWISALIAPYKAGLDETSLNSLSDDYVKFIRLAESVISKSNAGIVGMITNNSFVDGVVHRKMRLHLRKTFGKLFVINLHGDSNKKERDPEGGSDQNVFDIRQGVSITIAIKNGKSNELGQVFVRDIYGSRTSKYNWLWKSSLRTEEFVEANYQGEYHFFTNRPFKCGDTYEQGLKIKDLFIHGLSGVKFRKDKLLIIPNFSRTDAEQMVRDVSELPESTLMVKFGFKETADWKIAEQRKNFENAKSGDFVRVAYRPLDFRYTFYPLDRISRIIPRGDSRQGLMRNMIGKPNLALVAGRQNKSGSPDHFLAVDCLSEMKAGESTIQSYHFPLYLYPEEGALDQAIRVNFKPKLYARICEAANLKGSLIALNGSAIASGTFCTAKRDARPDEVKVFDYIYGVLYSPSYRSTYAEFLRIDFARIPLPDSFESFRAISEQGEELRRLHLMEPAAIGPTPFPFEGDGDSVVNKPRYKDGKIWINPTQGFAGVPPIVWVFQIGGYQPAQKWLKDRKGRVLTYDDIRHYQRIIKILDETHRIMGEIELLPCGVVELEQIEPES